jgi:hypothetical protein
MVKVTEDLAQLSARNRAANNREKRERMHALVDELCDLASREEFMGQITLELNAKNGYLGTPAAGSKAYG